MPYRGLYRVDVDNSYSWINHKVVFFHYSLLTPLEIQANNRYTWIKEYFPGVQMNKVSPKKIV